MRKISIVSMALMLMLGANLAGCSKKTGPTNADIVKAAIQRAVAENCNILTPSIKVLSRTINDDSAAITIGYVCGGIANSGIQHEMTLQMTESKDGSGRPVWIVQ